MSTEKSTIEIDADLAQNATVPNYVAPVKTIVCKWIYMLQG